MIVMYVAVIVEGVMFEYWHPRKPADQEAFTPITQFEMEWGTITFLAV